MLESRLLRTNRTCLRIPEAAPAALRCNGSAGAGDPGSLSDPSGPAAEASQFGISSARSRAHTVIRIAEISVVHDAVRRRLEAGNLCGSHRRVLSRREGPCDFGNSGNEPTPIVIALRRQGTRPLLTCSFRRAQTNRMKIVAARSLRNHHRGPRSPCAGPSSRLSIPAVNRRTILALTHFWCSDRRAAGGTVVDSTCWGNHRRCAVRPIPRR
jgi:hypothetical protein